jgi:carbon-monoxide dehydrogenase large subunit
MSRFGFGKPIRRSEDVRFLTGRARYVDDIALHGIAHALVLRSPHAHAHLRDFDITAASNAPGVLAVLIGKDAIADGLGGIGIRRVPPGFGGPKAFWPMRPVLAIDRVRHVGDGVALVVAETLAMARNALELVEVEYDILPSIASVGDASKPGAERIWDEAEGNICFEYQLGNRQATDAAFAMAAHVAKLSTVNNRVSANPLETRGAIGLYDTVTNRYTLYSSTQAPHRTRETLCDTVFSIPETEMRVVGPDVGGGFGMKGPTFPEEALVLWAARRVGRPVKWIAERSESMVSDAHGRDQDWIGEIAFDDGGRMLAVRVSADHNMGGYVSNNAHIPAMISGVVLPSVYACRHFYISFRGLFTNTPMTGPYRGAGQPESAFLIEQLLDRGALELGIDRLEIRRRNFIPMNAVPYRTPLGHTYDSGEFEALMDDAVRLADWDRFAARRAESERRGMLRGIGLASFIELTAIYNDRMEVRIDPSGAATIVAGTFSHGQGHETVFPQMLSEWLGVPFENIRVIQGDTDRVAFGRGTYASRSMSIGGASLRLAADEVIDKGRRIAAHLMEAAVEDIDFADGKFTVTGTDRSIDIAGVARASFAAVSWPQALGVGLEGVGGFTPSSPNYPNGCHVCEVEVDPETGRVMIERYCAVDDVGRAVNPLLLEGQIHGGVAQGIGQALKETVVFDPDSAQMLSGSFMDYAMPRASDIPNITIGLHDVPCLTNPIGVKGAGEAGCVGAPPAVISAILDALRPYGVTDIAMPATPERVWQAIQDARRPSERKDLQPIRRLHPLPLR